MSRTLKYDSAICSAMNYSEPRDRPRIYGCLARLRPWLLARTCARAALLCTLFKTHIALSCPSPYILWLGSPPPLPPGCTSFHLLPFMYSSLHACTPLTRLLSPPSLVPCPLSPVPSPDGQPSLLPPEQVQQLNVRSTGMLNSVQRLFSHHMIHTFGCDYSTGGVTLDALQAKLRNFLDVCTAEGPRHDTYLVFYSGHTYKGTGAWALAGKKPVKAALHSPSRAFKSSAGRYDQKFISRYFSK